MKVLFADLMEHPVHVALQICRVPDAPGLDFETWEARRARITASSAAI